MAALSLEQFLEIYRDPIARLYSSSNAPSWHVSRSSFANALWKSFDRRFGADASAVASADAVHFLDSLHAADLALAIGCRDGDADAWRHLVATYRAPVDAFARAVLGNSSRASEIADSLWADLYGLRGSDGARRSPLDHYGGRSSLMSWMRVVVTRLEADQWRATRRMEPLDEARDRNSNGSSRFARSRSRKAARRPRAISQVKPSTRSSPDDRLRLSYYYVHDLTLAQTAALLGEHESSASRNLARARTAIRECVTRTLRREYRFSDDQIDQCFEYATGDWPFDLGRMLALGK